MRTHRRRGPLVTGERLTWFGLIAIFTFTVAGMWQMSKGYSLDAVWCISFALLSVVITVLGLIAMNGEKE
jgi:hypothetical protein